MDFEDFLIALGAGALVVGLIFFVVILSTIVGLFTGWVISISPLNWWVEQGFLAIGLDVSGKITHVGATVGFISGFFTAYHSKKSSDD